MPTPFQHTQEPSPPVYPSSRTENRRLEAMAQERRQWIARSIASLFVAAMVLFVVVTVRRDAANRALFVESLEVYVQSLNDVLEKTRYLPAVWKAPEFGPKPRLPLDAFTYCDDAIRQLAVQSDEPAVVAWGPLYAMVFGRDGRAVAVYDHGKVRVEWVSEIDFRRRLDAQQARLEKAVRDSKPR